MASYGVAVFAIAAPYHSNHPPSPSNNQLSLLGTKIKAGRKYQVVQCHFRYNVVILAIEHYLEYLIIGKKFYAGQGT